MNLIKQRKNPTKLLNVEKLESMKKYVYYLEEKTKLNNKLIDESRSFTQNEKIKNIEKIKILKEVINLSIELLQLESEIKAKKEQIEVFELKIERDKEKYSILENKVEKNISKIKNRVFFALNSNAVNEPFKRYIQANLDIINNSQYKESVYDAFEDLITKLEIKL